MANLFKDFDVPIEEMDLIRKHLEGELTALGAKFDTMTERAFLYGIASIIVCCRNILGRLSALEAKLNTRMN